MPLEAATADQPSTKPPFADTLSDNRRPALSSSSDMPVIDLRQPAPAEPVDTDAEAANPDGTAGETQAGEADGAPTKEAPGEETDKTSPQQRAAFARERNRRQAAEREAAEFRAQVTQLAEAVSKLTKQAEPKDDRPARETFDDPNAYDKALEDWAGRRAKELALTEAKAEQSRLEVARHTETVVNTFNERKAAFEADHPDFEDVVYSDDVKISPPMSQAILEADDGPAIAYYLGQNPEVAERVSKLSPAQAVYEIGRISSRLANPPKPKPEPIKPLSSRNSGGPRSPDEMSMDEYALVSPNARKTH